ncbi:sensor histidine kinase [Hymenobacter lapidiphilus]|uniref:Histidine kinase n=1 Tax=Hymenobacter lapidiphilus TaxID=2608003 RepID=A0A7Y7U5B6_9BACT|nr:histidine kinase [Hymenobacter lapidiphilus]NVO31288.1 histidine kinase [Hymenobacter lapidiphilus]
MLSAYAAVPAPTRSYWYCQAVGWALYATFNVVGFSILSRFSVDIFLISLVIALTLLGLTHALRYHIRALGWAQLAPLALLGRLLVANLLLSVLSQVIIWALIYWVVRPAPTGQPYGWGQFIGYALNVNLLLWLWEGFYFGWHYLSRSRQAEVDKWRLTAAVREAEMRTLKAQINPHFMFNGLNNIRALVMEDPARARAMITHLSDLLRYSIQLNSTEQVPLARELEIVEHYLQLEAIQLEERLSYSLDVDPAALPVLIPPMTVQLLIENAIKHGLAPRPEGGTIQLTAQLNDSNTLHLRVRNTGCFAPTPGHEGVGLRNARERLVLLFGPAAHLHLANDPHCPNTVVAHLQLPVQSGVDKTPVMLSEGGARAEASLPRR